MSSTLFSFLRTLTPFFWHDCDRPSGSFRPLRHRHTKIWKTALTTNIGLIGHCLALEGRQTQVNNLAIFAQTAATFGITSAAYFLWEVEQLSDEEYNDLVERDPVSHCIRGCIPTLCCEISCALILVAAAMNHVYILIIVPVLVLLLIFWQYWVKLATGAACAAAYIVEVYNMLARLLRLDVIFVA